MLTVYQAQQITWNNGKMSDFTLPRHLGYFLLRDAAVDKIASDMSKRPQSPMAEEFVTTEDYVIISFQVTE